MAPSSSKFSSLTGGLSRLFSSDTAAFVVKRLLQALLTLLLASALSFLIIQLAPGNFLDILRQDPQISPETVQDLEARFGLDQPVWEQYRRWL
ncbi:MAG: ABC transporter permease, partial [Cyanobacteria bacterium P01_A01_bin.135]